MARLDGKIALVTGAGGGIGKAIVERLKRDGARVAVSDIDLGTTATEGMFEGDLADAKFSAKLPGLVSAVMGGLDILVNNAGVITRGKITDTTDEDYARTMAINVEAPFRLCRATIPIMAASGGGAIINTASCWGLRPGPDHPLYVMSKAAIASLTQCLGRDHAHQNIRVNAVCPNEVNTPMIRSGFEIRGLDPDQAIQELNKSVPLGRIAEPEDIADVVAFLAGPDARYMCGALVEINGGKPVG